MQKVRDSLPDNKKDKFSESAALVLMNNVDVKAIMAGAFAGNPDAVAQTQVEKGQQALNGKTADEIIAQADSIKVERAKKEEEQARIEIEELKTKQSKSEEDKKSLDMFTVTKSRFYLQNKDYGAPQPIIEITVKNGTDKAISRAYFKGTIASPGRSVPWFSDDFNYEISGGLEPGEGAAWSLAPNMFSDWAKINAPADAVFTVEVIKVDGADKKSLFDGSSFTEKDHERLASLIAKYPLK